MFWKNVFDFFGWSTGSETNHNEPDAPVVNPATGLPMLDNSPGGVDVGGSPYGFDTYHNNMSSFNDTSDPWS